MPFSFQAYLNGDDYAEHNPFGTIPSLTDHKEVFLTESDGCLLWILKRYGSDKLQPAADDFPAWAAYYNWLFRAGDAAATCAIKLQIVCTARPHNRAHTEHSVRLTLHAAAGSSASTTAFDRSGITAV